MNCVPSWLPSSSCWQSRWLIRPPRRRPRQETPESDTADQPEKKKGIINHVMCLTWKQKFCLKKVKCTLSHIFPQSTLSERKQYVHNFPSHFHLRKVITPSHFHLPPPFSPYFICMILPTSALLSNSSLYLRTSAYFPNVYFGKRGLIRLSRLRWDSPFQMDHFCTFLYSLPYVMS